MTPLEALRDLVDGWFGCIGCDANGQNEYVDLTDPDTHSLLAHWPKKIANARKVIAEYDDLPR